MCYKSVGSVAVFAILVASIAVLLNSNVQDRPLRIVDRFFDQIEYLQKYLRLPVPKNGPEISLLLVGAAGNGRSALGNYIVGRSVFDSRFSARMVTRQNKAIRNEIGPRKLLVVDTPGLLVNHDMAETEDVVENLKSSFGYSRTGYSAFLVVLNQAHRITKEQIDTIQILEIIFGDEFFKHAIFVFTHKDLFESSFDAGHNIPAEFISFIDNLPDSMAEFIRRADDRVLFVNSLETRHVINREFQIELIDMVDDMSRGSRYTKQSFDYTQEVLKEEIEHKLKMEDQERQEKEKVIWDKALATCRCGSDSKYTFKINIPIPGSNYLNMAINWLFGFVQDVVNLVKKPFLN